MSVGNQPCKIQLLVMWCLVAPLVSVAAQLKQLYWEAPAPITRTNSQFNTVVGDGRNAYCFFEEAEVAKGGGRLWIAMQTFSAQGWSAPKRIAGPFSYSGELPDCFSVALNKQHVLAVAVAVSDTSLRVYTSTDGGASFSETRLPEQEQTVVGPRLFVASNDAFMLFASLGAREVAVNNEAQSYERFAFSLVSAVSGDGVTWSPLAPFAPSTRLSNPFSPYLCAAFGGDVVVFQAQYSDGVSSRLSNQLYSSISRDGLQSWSQAALLTDERSVPATSSYTFTQLHNQRPYLFVQDSSLYMAWERTPYTADSADIWVSELSSEGTLRGSADQVSLYGNAHRPVLFSFDGNMYVLWFDSRRGSDSVYWAQKAGHFWDEAPLYTSDSKGWARFAYPVITGEGKELSFLWQEKTASKATPQLYALLPDRSVPLPRLSAISFTAGKRSTAQKVRARVVLPQDSSGIAGYSWLWTRDKDAEPPLELLRLSDDCELTARADEDGSWYFKVRALDYAGNWSNTATLAYYRDLTPPRAPSITLPPSDRYGFLSSNSFAMRWAADSRDDDVAGYSWSLEYLAPLPKQLAHTERHPLLLSTKAITDAKARLLASHANLQQEAALPPRRNLGAKTTSSYTNCSNGLYVFSVCAIDTVGNISERALVPLVLNKYVPSTAIVAVQSTVDTFGAVDVTVLGRDFTYDGTISAVYIDRDGEEPYDLAFYEKNGDYIVQSDDCISALHIDYAAEGVYKIGVLHSDRGVYFSDKTLKIDEFGTVKLETPYQYSPDWLPVPPEASHALSVHTLLGWTLWLFAVACMLTALGGLSQAAKETIIMTQEVHALLTGGSMLFEKKKRAAVLLQRRSSLKAKLALFTTLLVLGIVTLVSVPLGFVMMQVQERTLTEGLEQRIDVLMNSIASSVRNYLPAQNDLELSALPNLASSLQEMSALTILGLPRDMHNTNINYVWATNDSDITAHIDTEELVQGSSRLNDPVVATIISRFGALNEEALLSVGEFTQRISELSAEGTSLALRTDDESLTRRAQINDEMRILTNRSTELLEELSRKASGSYPAFTSDKLDRTNTQYLFYKPVLYRQGSEAMYVRALVLMQVSTDDLIQAVDAASRTLIYIAAVIALVAITIGSVGSILLAAVIVRPIRSLVAHVEMISRTRHKEQLAGQQITVKTRDEIGLLGETVNEMTRSLVKAALDETLLMDGKAVQQAFIPLLTDSHGNKATTAGFSDDAVQLFGYYEGASGVSGDYFDYKKLDERWYCFIKCDASGHGVPAALIMTVVATLFRQYFDTWTWRINGTNLNSLVTQINDFIESLGLKGKFATLMLCLFDTKSGDVYMCNAGDNIIHYYDRSDHVERTVSLTETPAAGPLPSFMIDMKGGFQVESLHLDKGDVLFLYTDGIEESTRKFRDARFAVMKCMDGKDGAPHDNHKVGEESEQLSPERIQAIIEAVFARSSYTLTKYHNPLFDESLVFDFTSCKGTVEDAVLALASVEKVFRMYKDPQCTEADTVRVDRNIDHFLKAHFNRYDFYCAQQLDSGETNYVYYTHLKEDEQMDDLTLLAIQKN